MTCKSGKETELKQALLHLQELSRKEPDCIAYELWEDKNNPRSIIIYERFKTAEALTKHITKFYAQEFMHKEYKTCVISHWYMDLEKISLPSQKLNNT